MFEIDLPVPFATHNIDPPSQTATASKEELLHMYRQMVVTRRMETAADALYKQKFIRGFCHLQSGQVWLSFCRQKEQREMVDVQ